MSLSPFLVKKLFVHLAETANENLNHAGFLAMSEFIKAKVRESDVSQEYLYKTFNSIEISIKDNIERKRNHKSKSKPYLEKMVRTSIYKLDFIAKAAGFKSFTDFKNKKDSPPDGILTSCCGNWWYIIRSYTGEYIVKAPARIFLGETDGKIKMELQGRELYYRGSVELRAGNVFCILDSGKEKLLYLVSKIGTCKTATLMQGVFCTISTATEPVGGRHLLIKENGEEFNKMKWDKLSLRNAPLDKRIIYYFKKLDNNCTQIGRTNTFDLSDIDIR